MLKNLDYNIIKATSGHEAFHLMLKHDFALVLLDIQMPEMDGFETAELMRSNEKTKYTPIIFITGNNQEQSHVFKGYESGAVDYLFKPLDPDILKGKVNVFIELYRQRKLLAQSREKYKRKSEEMLQTNNRLEEILEELKHKGRIMVESILGKGAAFIVKLPLSVTRTSFNHLLPETLQ